MALDYGCTPYVVSVEEYHERVDEVAIYTTYNCSECNRCLCMYWEDYNPHREFDPCNDCYKEVCPVVCVHYERFQLNDSQKESA